jgi:hypothetical protein
MKRAGESPQATARTTGRRQRQRDEFARDFIAQHADLAEAVAKADARSQSTGASLMDYVTLYRAVHKWQARTVLECGTGKTTFALAAAMKALGGALRLVSMEHEEEWHRQAKKHFPFDEFPFVEMHYSPKAVWCISLLRGTVYSDVPPASYDLVFVDGPSAHIGEQTSCNMDFVRLVSNSERPIPAIIDSRKPTVMAYAILFPGKVRFSAHGLGIVDPVSRADLAFLDKTILLKSFARLVDVCPDDPIDLWQNRPSEGGL